MAIIKNYGLRWVRENVAWKRTGEQKKGLYGRRIGQKRAECTDFSDQIGVYVLYEQGFSPVYVGQAGFGKATLLRRLDNHRDDHLRDRWSHFSWFGFKRVNADLGLHQAQSAKSTTSLTYNDAMDEFEGILIQILEPRLNKQGATWPDAHEYIQQGLEPEADRVTEISERLDEVQVDLRRIVAQLHSLTK